MSQQLPAGLRPANPPSDAGGSSSGGQQSGPSAEEVEAQKQAQHAMISQILEPAARERLSRIALVKPDMAQRVTELLVRLARGGQIKGKVSDDELKGLLEQVSAQSQPKPPTAPTITSSRTKSLGGGITIQRKRDDSDSDEYDL